MIKYISNQTDLFNTPQGIESATVQECLDWCASQSVIEVDSETNGHWLKGGILSLQLGNKDIQWVIDCKTVDIKLFRIPLEDSKILKLFWNAKYDLKYLLYFDIFCTNVYDGFLAECILTTGIEGRQLSLGACAKNYIGAELDKSIRGLIHKEGLTSRVIKYAAEDVEHLGKIRDLQMVKIKELNLERTLELENKFTEVLAAIEYKGFKIDQKKWLEVEADNFKKLGQQRLVLDKWIVDNNILDYFDYQGDLFSNSSEPRARTRSVKNKKVKYLFDSSKDTIVFLKHLGIPTQVVDKVTGKLKDSAEAKHIKKYSSMSSFIKPYIEYQELRKLISTYGKKFLIENVNKTDYRLHCEFWQIINTGRISSRNPNLQNIPARGEVGTKLRSCFIPESGNVLIINDYSSQEPRVTADKCGDPALIDFFLNGDGDPHSLVARKMYSFMLGKDVHVDKDSPYIEFDGKKINARNNGKILNLKLDYGGSAFTVKDELGTTQAEAQKMIDALYEAFPMKKEYFKQVVRDTFANGYITINNVTNRKTFIDRYDEYKELKAEVNNPDFWDKYKSMKSCMKEEDFKKTIEYKKCSRFFKWKSGIERDSMNYPTQGTSADMSKLAAIRIYREFKKQGWHFLKDAGIVNLVHDEIVTECSDSIKDLVAIITRQCMEEAGLVFCPVVPMVAESDIALFWRKG